MGRNVSQATDNVATNTPSGGSRVRYTDEQKAEAVELYRTQGATVAAEIIGCNKGTVTRWAQAAGVTTEVIPRTQAATDTAKALQGLSIETTRAFVDAYTEATLRSIVDTWGKKGGFEVDLHNDDGWLYVYEDANGDALYVGSSQYPPGFRLAAHATTAGWFGLAVRGRWFHFDTLPKARLAEYALIRALQPPYNVVKPAVRSRVIHSP